MSVNIDRWSEDCEPAAADIKRRLESEGYRVFQWSDAPGTQYAPHAHAEDQSHWIISGVLELTVDGETYVLSAGDRDFLPANTLHSALVPGEAAVTYLIGAKS